MMVSISCQLDWTQNELTGNNRQAIVRTWRILFLSLIDAGLGGETSLDMPDILQYLSPKKEVWERIA